MKSSTTVKNLSGNCLPVLFASALLTTPAFAAEQRPASAAPMEKQVLFAPESAKKWSQAECSLEPSTARQRAGMPTLHWHITVDYTTGEPKYPIGWPRITYAVPAGPQRDWSGWDFLHFWVYTDTSRETLPRDPVGLSLSMPDKSSTLHRPLAELKKGAWIEITVPIATLIRPGDVRVFQFHISESNYRHQDTLDFYIDDLALLRYAKPTLLDFAAERAVMFVDAKSIPATFRLVGIQAGQSTEVACELRQQGRVAARTSLKASRGPQHALFDVSHARLQPGDYEMIATVPGGTQAATAKVRLVESPWK